MKTGRTDMSHSWTMAKVQMPDQVFNWIKDSFDDHMHCTKYSGELSSFACIRASVIQGSGLGPASYLITAADLRPVHEGNSIVRFADDTYLIIAADNCDTPSLDTADMANFRPVSNLTFMSKVIERVVARRLNDYLAEHSLLPRC